jgi:hypothetical protein
MKMNYLHTGIVLGVAMLGFNDFAFARGPAIPADQKMMLLSQDPKMAANKKIVYDFWREVLEAGHMDLAPKYMTETYIQHNPNVPTGRQGSSIFSHSVSHNLLLICQAPLIAIIAEGDR